MRLRGGKKGSGVLDLEVQRKKAHEEEKDAREKEEFDAKLKLSVDRKDAGNITVLRGKEQDVVETIQNRTFTKWANQILLGNGEEGLGEDLVISLKQGEHLCRLLRVLSAKSLGSKAGSSIGGTGQFQSLAQHEQAFQFMREERVHLVGIGPQDVLKGNRKLILGLVWALILHYHMQPILSQDKGKRGSGKEDVGSSLLGWVREKLRTYSVTVKDFRVSFKDGKVFCCLVDSLKSGLIDVEHLDPKNAQQNLRLAIQKADEVFGIPPLIEPQGFDELSTMLYVSYFRKKEQDVKKGEPLERVQVVKEEELEKEGEKENAKIKKREKEKAKIKEKREKERKEEQGREKENNNKIEDGKTGDEEEDQKSQPKEERIEERTEEAMKEVKQQSAVQTDGAVTEQTEAPKDAPEAEDIPKPSVQPETPQSQQPTVQPNDGAATGVTATSENAPETEGIPKPSVQPETSQPQPQQSEQPQQAQEPQQLPQQGQDSIKLTKKTKAKEPSPKGIKRAVSAKMEPVVAPEIRPAGGSQRRGTAPKPVLKQPLSDTKEAKKAKKQEDQLKKKQEKAAKKKEKAELKKSLQKERSAKRLKDSKGPKKSKEEEPEPLPENAKKLKKIGTLLDPVADKKPVSPKKDQSSKNSSSQQQSQQPAKAAKSPKKASQELPSPKKGGATDNKTKSPRQEFSSDENLLYEVGDGAGGMKTGKPVEGDQEPQEFKPVILDVGAWAAQSHEKENLKVSASTLKPEIFHPSQVSADDDEEKIDEELKRLMELRKQAERRQQGPSGGSTSSSSSSSPAGDSSGDKKKSTLNLSGFQSPPSSPNSKSPPGSSTPSPSSSASNNPTRPAPVAPKHSRLFMKTAQDEDLSYLANNNNSTEPKGKPKFKVDYLPEIPTFKSN